MPLQYRGAEKDHELILQNVVQEKAKYFRAVRRLFAQRSGTKFKGWSWSPVVRLWWCATICGQHYHSWIMNPWGKNYYSELRDSVKSWKLQWTRLDKNADGGINCQEFEAWVVAKWRS